jgi:peptidoglycan/LPS O-acetylase OafA/YrhL
VRAPSARSRTVRGVNRRGFVPALEGLRGYAALLIAVYHAWVLSGQGRLGAPAIRDGVSAGLLAVDLFFVLSAFVLFLPVVRTGAFPPAGEYALRRAARILPAYWLSLLLAIVLAAALGAGYRVDAPGILAHLSFTEVEWRLLPGYRGTLGFTVNPVVWSLAVEAAFYVVLPFVAVAYSRRPVLWLAGSLAAVAVMRATLHGEWLSLPPLFAADFAAGMTAAWLAVRRPAPAAAVPVAVLAAALVLVKAGGADAGDVRVLTRASVTLGVVLPLAFGALVWAFASAPRFTALADNAAARWAGKVSFGVFLVHFMVMRACVDLLGFPHDGSGGAFAALLAAGLAGAFALAYFSWRFVEAPIRRSARHVGRDVAADRHPLEVGAG